MSKKEFEKLHPLKNMFDRLDNLETHARQSTMKSDDTEERLDKLERELEFIRNFMADFNDELINYGILKAMEGGG